MRHDGGHGHKSGEDRESDPELKRRIRDAAEREEHEFYHGRAPDDWLEALAPLGTDEHKTHLTDAPWVVVLFRQSYVLRRGAASRVSSPPMPNGVGPSHG